MVVFCAGNRTNAILIWLKKALINSTKIGHCEDFKGTKNSNYLALEFTFKELKTANLQISRASFEF